MNQEYFQPHSVKKNSGHKGRNFITKAINKEFFLFITENFQDIMEFQEVIRIPIYCFNWYRNLEMLIQCLTVSDNYPLPFVKFHLIKSNVVLLNDAFKINIGIQIKALED